MSQIKWWTKINIQGESKKSGISKIMGITSFKYISRDNWHWYWTVLAFSLDNLDTSEVFSTKDIVEVLLVLLWFNTLNNFVRQWEDNTSIILFLIEGCVYFPWPFPWRKELTEKSIFYFTCFCSQWQELQAWYRNSQTSSPRPPRDHERPVPALPG